MYFDCTAKFLTFLDVGEILDLFYLYCKILDIFGCWRLKIALVLEVVDIGDVSSCW